MAARLLCANNASLAVTSAFNMKLANKIYAGGKLSGTRPRGHDKFCFHPDLRHGSHRRIRLNLTVAVVIIFITSFAVSVSLGVGYLLDLLQVLQEVDLLTLSRLFDCPFFSRQVGIQQKELAVLPALSILALLVWICSRIITALAQRPRGNQEPSHSPIAHHLERSSALNRTFLHRKVSIKTSIPFLSFLALGLYPSVLLRSRRVYQEKADFCSAEVQLLQQLYQTFKKANLRIIAALVTAPPSLNQIAPLNEVIHSFFTTLKIGRIRNMDPRSLSKQDIYRPIKDRMAEEEALTLKDSQIGAAEIASSLDTDAEPVSTYTAIKSARRTVTWAPDPERIPPSHWSQSRIESRRREESAAIAVAHSSFNTRSSSLNQTPGIQMLTMDDNSAVPGSLKSPHTPSPGHPLRHAIKKTRSSIFRSVPSQEDTEVPTTPTPNFASRAASNIFRRNAKNRKHAPALAGRTIGNPQLQGPTGLVLIRDMEMEERARAMGFNLPPNRFGLEEKVFGKSSAPNVHRNEVSSTAETMAGSAISDDASHYSTDDELTVFGADSSESLPEDQELRTPPCAAKSHDDISEGGLGDLDPYAANSNDEISEDGLEDLEPSAVNPNDDISEGGLGDLEDNNTDALDWLRNAFSPPATPTPLENFSAPLNVSLVSPRTSLSLEVSDEDRNSTYSLDAPQSLAGSIDMASNHGASQMPTKSEFTRSSKGERSSHKKSRSQEGSFLKSFRGTAEPSLDAFQQLKERTLTEANADEKDLNLAAKLNVSSRQLPPDAPKPASKDPVPKAKSGTSGMLRRLSSMDNLMRRDAKGSASPESKNSSTRNASQSPSSSQLKEAPLTSITEESTARSKPSQMVTDKDVTISYSEGYTPPADHHRHARSGRPLTGEHGQDLNLAFADLAKEKAELKESGAIPQGWDYMGTSKDHHQEECCEHEPIGEESVRSLGERRVTGASFRSLVGALVTEDRVGFSGDHSNEILRSYPPTRNPPPLPGGQTHSTHNLQEVSGEYGGYGGYAAQEGQPSRAPASAIPERFNVNKAPPEVHPGDGSKESKKDGKKRGLKSLFSRK